MKLTRMNHLAKPLIAVGLMAAALGYVSLSYGQEASTTGAPATTPKYDNVTTGYKIGGNVVLTMPGGATGDNTALGYLAFTANTTGTQDTALGYDALNGNTTGHANTAAGYEALLWNTTGYNNTAFGWQALVNNHLAGRNTAVGVEALHNNDLDDAGTGSQNTAVGWEANFYNQDGTNNTGLGYQACLNVVEGNNVTCIGANAGPSSDVTGPATYIANVYGQPTTGSGNPLVCISSDGLLGTTGCASSGERMQVVRQQQVQIHDQARRIAELEQRLSRLESLIGKQ